MKLLIPLLLMMTALGFTLSEPPKINMKSKVNSIYAGLEPLYLQLHQHPELSFQERKTALTIGKALEKEGFNVTYNIGGHGIVGILKNGDGPTLLIRTDLDALPITENTGLPYASKVTALNDEKKTVGVMHACGHDIHMTSFVGTAQVLSQMKDSWCGTLVMIGQPAEEKGAGARAMLEDGLFEKFPLPDFCLALHVAPDLEAGKVAYSKGFSMANVDTVDITIKGKGGHGAAPHKAIDPVVVASQCVVNLQTIRSRELNPTTPAVITVGSIHGGTKHNIIPDEVRLQLTVRSYADKTRAKILESIKRITRSTALTANVPEDNLPIVSIKPNYTPSLYNDPKLTEILVDVFIKEFGHKQVVERSAEMIGEDFARYGRTTEKVPICMFRIGTVKRTSPDQVFPSLHSASFAPIPEPTIKTGVRAMTSAALHVLQK